MTSDNIAPPPDTTVLIIDVIQPWIVLTILGHEHNLLVTPKVDGFEVHHHNIRYSANRKEVKYVYESRDV